jgi:hypothetical protein
MSDFESIGRTGDFKLDETLIIGVDGTPVDVTLQVAELEIIEDIENPHLQGTIAFFDQGNFQNLLPLIGNEILQLKIRTPGLDDNEDIIEALFFLDTMIGTKDINDNNRMHVFEFQSLECITNQRKSVKRTLKGTIADMIKTVLRNDLESTKDFYVDPCVGIKSIIAPDMSPFNFINMIQPQAVSKMYKNPTYMFFENMRGFHFRALESLYDIESHGDIMRGNYTTSTAAGLNRNKKGGIDALIEYSQMRDYTVNLAYDQTIDSKNGAYGSSLITHDIHNKTFTETSYNYLNSFEDEKHINSFFGKKQNPLYSKVAVNKFKSTASDVSQKSFYLPVSLADRDKRTDSHYYDHKTGHIFSAYNPDSWITKRTTMIHNFDAVSVSMFVDGHTMINAGNIVEVNIPYNSRNKGDEQLDKFFKGPMLVRNIKHMFDTGSGKHTMQMSCVKDCVEEELPGSPELFPVPDTYGKFRQLKPLNIEY